jgi:beta-galactosidase
VVDRNQSLFLNARPVQAQMAVVYNPLAHFVGGRQRAAVYGGPQGEAQGIERDSLLGIHRALFPSNVPFDYVHIEELTPELAAKYKLIYLPYPLMLPRRVGAVLAEYVRSGGALVSEARAGWNDERGWAADTIPGFGLHEIFSARETAIRTVPPKTASLVWSGADLPGVKDGERLPGRLFEETLEPIAPRGRVAARGPNGPAAVMSAYGKGKTLLLGTYLSAAFEVTQDPTLRRFFTGLLDWAGVERPVEVTGEAEVRLLESGRDRLAFVFNHGAQPATISLQMRGDWAAVDLVSGEAVRELSEQLAARDVWVLRLSPK